MSEHKESEQWLHEKKGWIPTGGKNSEQFHPKYKMMFRFEGRDNLFRHVPTGKVFIGMEQEVCAEVDGWMHSNGYYKKKIDKR